MLSPNRLDVVVVVQNLHPIDKSFLHIYIIIWCYRLERCTLALSFIGLRNRERPSLDLQEALATSHAKYVITCQIFQHITHIVFVT